MAQETSPTAPDVLRLRNKVNGQIHELGADNAQAHRQLALPREQRAVAFKDLEYVNVADAAVGESTPASSAPLSGAAAPVAGAGESSLANAATSVASNAATSVADSAKGAAKGTTAK